MRQTCGQRSSMSAERETPNARIIFWWANLLYVLNIKVRKFWFFCGPLDETRFSFGPGFLVLVASNGVCFYIFGWMFLDSQLGARMCNNGPCPDSSLQIGVGFPGRNFNFFGLESTQLACRVQPKRVKVEAQYCGNPEVLRPSSKALPQCCFEVGIRIRRYTNKRAQHFLSFFQHTSGRTLFEIFILIRP